MWDLISEDLDLLIAGFRILVNPHSSQIKRETWDLMSELAMFPAYHSKEISSKASLHEVLNNPPKDLINIDTYLGKGLFKDCEALRNDKRSNDELVKALLETKEYPDLNKLKAGVLWTRLVHDEVSLKKAVKVSYYFAAFSFFELIDDEELDKLMITPE